MVISDALQRWNDYGGIEMVNEFEREVALIQAEQSPSLESNGLRPRKRLIP